jgi:uncharacterized iron-regulated protein
MTLDRCIIIVLGFFFSEKVVCQNNNDIKDSAYLFAKIDSLVKTKAQNDRTTIVFLRSDLIADGVIITENINTSKSYIFSLKEGVFRVKEKNCNSNYLKLVNYCKKQIDCFADSSKNIKLPKVESIASFYLLLYNGIDNRVVYKTNGAELLGKKNICLSKAFSEAVRLKLLVH